MNLILNNYLSFCFYLKPSPCKRYTEFWTCLSQLTCRVDWSWRKSVQLLHFTYEKCSYFTWYVAGADSKRLQGPYFCFHSVIAPSSIQNVREPQLTNALFFLEQSVVLLRGFGIKSKSVNEYPCCYRTILIYFIRFLKKPCRSVIGLKRDDSSECSEICRTLHWLNDIAH